MSKIPLVDLAWQHSQVASDISTGFERVMRDTAFILGNEVSAFEEQYATFLGVKHVVGVANGTDALELALRALGVGTGDEVILPANTFIATALAVVRAAAKPVFADCDPRYQLLDPEQVERRMTPRTRAIIPVHLFGQIAPVEQLNSRVPMVEDAAQCQGATRHGRHGGSFGRVAGTSFYPGKNLGAYGDAGAVLTNDDAVAQRVRALRNYGSEVKYHHPEAGFNSRLDTLQAVVLQAKLRRLREWNEARTAAARRYDRLLLDVPEVVRPETLPGNEHVWHLYVVRVPRRDDVLRRMNEAGVGVGVHYPVPVHLQGAMATLGHRPGDFPVTEKASEEILSLPIYPGVTSEQQERVVQALKQALSG